MPLQAFPRQRPSPSSHDRSFLHLFHVAIPNALHVGTQKPATNIPKQQRTKVNSQHIKTKQHNHMIQCAIHNHTYLIFLS